MNKRILIVRKYGGYGGIEHQIVTISSGLISQGWEVFFLTNTASPLSQDLEKKGVTVIAEEFNGVLDVARLICRVCKQRGISLIQSHMLKESFYCRLAKLLMPSLKHVFRVHTYIDCSNISEKKKRIYHLLCFITDSLVTKYISINEFNVREMRNRTHLPKRKISVVHNAVRALQVPTEVCAHKNGKIAMIANFVDFKGHDVLLEGLKILKEKGLYFEAHLYGSTPGYGTPNEDRRRLDIIEKTIAEYGLEKQVVFEGYCKDIASAISQCGMVVLPSDSEGTPNVLLEGMLLQKIVVASSVGGVPEFVIDGKTGFLHEAKSGQAFADALMRAYEKPTKELMMISKDGRNTVFCEYSKEQLIKELEKIYTEL